MSISKMNKRGQLAFVAVLIMLALIWYGFKSQEERLEITVLGGDRQAELVSAYAEPEQFRLYMEQAAKQAIFETYWTTSGASQSCSFSGEPSEEFKKSFDNLINNYMYVYTGADELLTVSIPDYNTSLSYVSGKAVFEARGRAETCESIVPYPPRVCFDQTTAEECNKIAFDNNQQACSWDGVKCIETRPQPNCDDALALGTQPEREQACISKTDNFGRTCEYTITDADPLLIRQDQFADYFFEIEAASYIKAEVTCDEYLAYASERANKYAKPECVLLAPTAVQAGSGIEFTASYQSWDNIEPEVLRITANDPAGTSINLLTQGTKSSVRELSDGNYQNYENWTYTHNIADAGTYTAELFCKPKFSAVTNAAQSTITVNP